MTAAELFEQRIESLRGRNAELREEADKAKEECEAWGATRPKEQPAKSALPGKASDVMASLRRKALDSFTAPYG
jgi:hypothetical protein